MADQMERYVGREWELRYDELTDFCEQQQQICYTEEAHGRTPQDEPLWAGVRRSDEQTSAVGF